MLYSRAYNEGMTKEMRTAYLNRDAEALQGIIKTQCQELLLLSVGDSRYHHATSQLQISLALLNSICKRGETVAFINDVVNF